MTRGTQVEMFPDVQRELLVDRMLAWDPDPPAFASVGCSLATEPKHLAFASVMEWFARMHTPNVRFGRQFIYAETHAGAAWYVNRKTRERVLGSPLIGLDALERLGLFDARPYQAFLCERDARAFGQLRRSVEGLGRLSRGTAELYNGSSDRLIDLLPATGGLCGLIFVDPNGGVSNELIAVLASTPRLERVDFVVWQDANLSKRFRAVAESPRWKLHNERYFRGTVGELMEALGKSTWLIRTPFTAAGGQRRTMLIGTNWDETPEWPSGGIYRLDSLHGQAILAECDG